MSALVELQERLTKAELETGCGTKWFETWLATIGAAGDASPAQTQALEQMAKRLDAVIVASAELNYQDVKTTTTTTGAAAGGEKRPLEAESSAPPPPQQQPPQPAPSPEIVLIVSSDSPEFVVVEVSPVTEEEEDKPVVAVEEEEPVIVDVVEEPAPAPVAVVAVVKKEAPAPAAPAPKSRPPPPPSSSSVAKPAKPAPPSPAAAAAPKPAPPSPAAPKPKPAPPSPAAAVPPSPVAAAAPKPAASRPPPPPSSSSSKMADNLLIPKEVRDVYSELKLRSKHRYLICKINGETNALEIESLGGKGETLDDFINKLPYAECRFAVVDYEWLKVDQYGSRMTSKAFFITWTPTPASTQHKMWYSTERKHVLGVFTGVETILASTKNDVLTGTGAKNKLDATGSDDEEDSNKADWMDE